MFLWWVCLERLFWQWNWWPIFVNVFADLNKKKPQKERNGGNVMEALGKPKTYDAGQTLNITELLSCILCLLMITLPIRSERRRLRSQKNRWKKASSTKNQHFPFKFLNKNNYAKKRCMPRVILTGGKIWHGDTDQSVGASSGVRIYLGREGREGRGQSGPGNCRRRLGLHRNIPKNDLGKIERENRSKCEIMKAEYY